VTEPSIEKEDPAKPTSARMPRPSSEEIQQSRQSDYEASRRRLGIRKEKVWFQSLLQGEMAVVYWEGEDPRWALQEFASSEDPFDEWLKERGREVYHFELSQTLEEDEKVFEAEVD